jgi:hypothetical protein
MDLSDSMEGRYLKVEDGGQTVGRLKLVRRGFTQTILDGGVHWSRRPFIWNRLALGVDIYAPELRLAAQQSLDDDAILSSSAPSASRP